MPFKKGQKKTGGAVKGKSSKRAKLLEQIRESGKDGPVEYLLKEMQEDDNDPAIRRDIAKVLLPYVEKRQPQAIEADVKSEMKVTLKPGDDEL